MKVKFIRKFWYSWKLCTLWFQLIGAAFLRESAEKIAEKDGRTILSNYFCIALHKNRYLTWLLYF